MKRFLGRRMTFRLKSVLMTIAVAGFALTLACSVILAHSNVERRATITADITVLADIIGQNLTADLAFDSPESATDTLQALSVGPEIIGGWVYTVDGQLFASFAAATYRDAEGQALMPDELVSLHHAIDVLRPIIHNDEELGTIHLKYDGSSLRSQLLGNAAIMLLIMAGTLCVAGLLTLRLQRMLAGPILNLARIAKQVSREKDYSLRAARTTDDELGELADAFNDMLTQIGLRDAALEDAREKLEERVEERTRDLVEAKEQAVEAAGALARKKAMVELLREVAIASNEAPDPDSAMQRAVNLTATIAGWEVGHVYVPKLDGSGVLEPTSIWYLADEERLQRFREVTEETCFAPGEGLPGRVLLDARPAWITDVRRDKNFPRNISMPDLEVGAGLAFPVLIGTEVVAVLEFFAMQPLEPDHELLAITSQIGTQLGRVFERCRSASERDELNTRLVETSRRAGMAEVATGVLHNVGNVLNSVNVSTTIVAEKIRKTDVADIQRIAEMLEEKGDAIGEFLLQDERGKLIPGYLAELGRHLSKEQVAVLDELDSLNRSVEHIKDIVGTQQSYAKVSGMAEPVQIRDLIDDAVRINNARFERHGVELSLECDEIPPITTDKHKVLQILINLLSNAKNATVESGRPDRRLAVRMEATQGTVVIEVEDNGVGIQAENITRIFSHGFTTRKEGHGFGLHSCALAAKVLGGSLTASSDGPGTGATFRLELPLLISEVTS